MTTVIADFQARTMVADSKCTTSESSFQTIKMRRMPDGSIVGVAGDLDDGQSFMDWMHAGCVAADKPVFNGEFDALVMKKDGLYLWNHRLSPTLVANGRFAIGSGAQFALGAMRAGADIERACVIAIEEDSGSGLPMMAMRLEDKKPARRRSSKACA